MTRDYNKMSLHRTHAPHLQRGFTLVEALIAVSILALIIGTASQLLKTHIAAAEKIRLATQISIAAHQHLNQLELAVPSQGSGGQYSSQLQWNLVLTELDEVDSPQSSIRNHRFVQADLVVQSADGLIVRRFHRLLIQRCSTGSELC